MNTGNLQLFIRPYEEHDELDVIKLWKSCNLVVSQNDPKKDIAMKIKFQPALFLMGIINNRIVSTVMVGYEGHRGWINYLAVSPEGRFKSIGSIMMEKAEEELRKLGCQKINLQIRASNKSAISFYKSIGFSNDNVISMGKRLVGDLIP